MASNSDFARQGRDKAQTDRMSDISIDVIGKHGELIATESGQEVTRPGGSPKALRDHLQNAISEGMAVEIIDSFEVVEVYQKERVLKASGRRRRRCCR